MSHRVLMPKINAVFSTKDGPARERSRCSCIYSVEKKMQTHEEIRMGCNRVGNIDGDEESKRSIHVCTR